MTMIQVRNVPEEIHRTLKARAALAGVSLSDLILKEITAAAKRPTAEEIRARLAALPPVTTTETSAEAIRAIRAERDAQVED